MEPGSPDSSLPESSPGAGTLIPCFLHGVGPEAQKAGDPAVKGHQARGPQTRGSRARRYQREAGEWRGSEGRGGERCRREGAGRPSGN